MPRIGRTRPASNYRHLVPIAQSILNAVQVVLTAPNIQLAAPVPSLSAGANLTLTTPNLALAAPLIAPGIGPTLTTPNLQLAAPSLFAFQTIELDPQPLIPIPIAGFGYQQADIINLWSNPAAFFQQRVIFRATQASSSQTLPSSGTLQFIVYDNIIEDPYAGWNFSIWTAPFAGWYQVTVTAWVTAPGATNTALQVFVETGKSPGNLLNNLALVSTPMPNAAGGSEGTWYVYLAAGDTVAGAAAIKNSASNVTTSLTSGQQSSMEIVWISS